MRKPFLLLSGLLLAGIIALVLLPSMLKRIPTRYALRLPEPLQAYALPADPTPILPTAVAPLRAASLLDAGPRPTATPPASPTPIAVAAAAEPTAAPTATLAPPTATPWPIPAAARMNGFVHKFQDWNNCGPATLAMALTYFGLTVSQQETAAALKPNAEDRNVGPAEMAAYVNNNTELRAIERTNGTRPLLQSLIASGVPVIIEVGIEPPGEFRWLGWYGHYLLPVAYDDALEQFWVYDSWFGTSEVPLENADPDGRVLSYADLEASWPQFNRNFIVLFRPDQEETVRGILGDRLDDAVMWRDSLARAKADASASPENAFYWFNLGTSYTALGEFENAAAAFDQARAIGLPWRMLWYQFGPYEAYYQVGRYDEVILLADTALQDRPYLEEAFYYKALALQAQGDIAGAAENFRQAADFNPNFRAARDALAALGDSGG